MITRRNTLASLLGPAALFGLGGTLPARGQSAALGAREKIRVTKIESFVLKNSWVFVKISTDAGITGWGEMLKDDAKACAAGALEVGHYLIGQDPTRVVHHWQAIHRGAFYRGGPVKTAISSHRPGAVGHYRQGLQSARPQADGRPHPRPLPRLWPARLQDRRQRHEGAAAESGGPQAHQIQ